MRVVLLTLVVLFQSFQTFATDKYFSSFDDTQIAFTDEGQGKKVVLLIHGFINTRKSFEGTAIKKGLLEAGYRLIIPDLRGNGDSDQSENEKDYSNDAEVKDLISLMDHLEVKKYIAIGYSRGSIILAKLLTIDSRIKKAVLGGMGLDFTNPAWDRRIMFMHGFGGKVKEYPETEGAVNYAMSINANLRILHLLQKYQPVTSRAALSKVKKKILVVAGEEDKDNGDPLQLAEVFPKGILVIVKGDHNTTYRKEPFAKAILDFL